MNFFRSSLFPVKGFGGFSLTSLVLEDPSFILSSCWSDILVIGCRSVVAIIGELGGKSKGISTSKSRGGGNSRATSSANGLVREVEAIPAANPKDRGSCLGEVLCPGQVAKLGFGSKGFLL